MTLTIDLPNDLENRIEQEAEKRGLDTWPFLARVFVTDSDIQEPGDLTIRELHTELMKHLQSKAATPKIQNGNIARPSGAPGTTDEEAITALIRNLKNQPIPQSLDDLKPRKLPPSGSTAMAEVFGKWPGNETDEELLAVLKALD